MTDSQAVKGASKTASDMAGDYKEVRRNYNFLPVQDCHAFALLVRHTPHQVVSEFTEGIRDGAKSVNQQVVGGS